MANRVVIGRVTKLNGKYIAKTSDGTERILDNGDLIYEGDAIFLAPDAVETGDDIALGTVQGQPVGEEVSGSGNEIEILLRDGQVLTMDDFSFVLLDSTIIGTYVPRDGVVEFDPAAATDLFESVIGGVGAYNTNNNPFSTGFPQSVLALLPKLKPLAPAAGPEPTPDILAVPDQLPENDLPVAINDSVTVVEGGAQLTGANVIDNDVPGADGAVLNDFTFIDTSSASQNRVFSAGNTSYTVTTHTGVLTVSQDGAWEFTPSSSVDQDLYIHQDSFDYRLIDGNGDISNTATQGIEVTDTEPTSAPILGTVAEANLAAGTSPNAPALMVSQSLNITKAQDDIVDVTFTAATIGTLSALGLTSDGNTINYALSNGDHTITANDGVKDVFTIELQNPTDTTGASQQYQFILLDRIDHGGSGGLDLTFPIVIEDIDLTGTSSDITVRVTDDAPVAAADGNSILEDGVPNTVTGNVVTSNADTIGADTTPSPVTGVAVGNTGTNGSGNVGADVAGAYGSVNIAADGSYTYTLDNSNLAVQGIAVGDTLTDLFTYTITDDDGSQTHTTLAITINGADDGIILAIPDNDIPGVGTEEVVYESGLDGGSSPDDSDIVNSNFFFKTLDGLQDLIVGGTTITPAELADSGTANITINTPKGVLVINGSSTAVDGTITVSYTYTLTANEDHSGGPVTDSIAITVNDTNADSASGVLDIRVADDVPTANADTNSITEDVASVSGNVITNVADIIGADATVTPVTGVGAGDVGGAVSGSVGSGVTGTYGSVNVATGGAYTYSLDSSNLAVQDLTTGEFLTDIFTYTITDSDGDVSTTTLTITINGADDGVVLTIPDNDGPAGGSEEVVYERGLATGSSPDNSDIVDSSFEIKALDGLKEIVVGGTTISAADLTNSGVANVTINTPKGVLVIDGFSSAADGTGIVNYTYTLSGNEDHSGGSVTDSISITVTDTDLDSATDSLDIRIVDDEPSAVDDTTVNVAEGGVAAVTTNLQTNDTPGADQPTPITGFSYTNESDTVVAGTVGVAMDTKYGTLTVNANGTWSYTSDATENHLSDPLSESFTYTITDSDNDTSTATQIINLTDTDPTVAPAAGTVHEHDLADGSLPDNAALTITKSINITKAADNITDTKFTAATITTLDALSLTSDGNTINYSLSNSDHTITANDGGKDIFTITIDNPTDATGTTQQYTFVLIDQIDHTGGNDASVNLGFPITVSDIDGSVAGNISVTVTDDVPTAVDDTTVNVVEGNIFAVTANLLPNDTFGADKAVTLTGYTYTNESGLGGQIANAGDTVNTQYGELTVNADGSWSYRSDLTEDHTASESVSESFVYTITDRDGDTSTATQIINVTDGADPTVDNANNTIVKVYEGDAKSTYDGVGNYNESDSVATKTTTPAATHKLDFTKGTDDADIVSFTFDSITKTITPGGSNTATSATKGTLKVFYDGTWEYTPPATYVHPDANGINNFQETFTYVVQDTDGDNAATTGSQTIQVDDTLGAIDSVAGSVVYEKYLPTGSTPSAPDLIQTKAFTLDVSNLEGPYDVTFDTSQVGLQSILDNLKSGGSAVSSFTLSSGDHTLTAKDAGSNTVFTVEINNPSGAASYTFSLMKSLEHVASVGGDDGTIDLPFAVSLEDDDRDGNGLTFTVTVSDDPPAANDNIILDEDTNLTFSTNANATGSNLSIITPPTYGDPAFDGDGVKINADGTLTYQSNPNYSGADSLTYRTTLDGGSTFDTTVAITVNPIVDAPTLNSATVNTLEDANNTLEGNNMVDLGLVLPTQNDQTDQNAGTAGDSPERLGLLDFVFSNGSNQITGTEIWYDSDGNGSVDTKLFTVGTDGNSFSVQITDGNYHPTDLTVPGGTKSLTQTQYATLEAKQVEDNANNIVFTIATESHEVQDSGALHSPDVVSSTQSQTITADVQAVTDPVSITLFDTDGGGTAVDIPDVDTVNLTLNEDTTVDLKNVLVEGFGDFDLSETHSYEITGLPAGFEVNIGGTSYTSTGAVITAPISGGHYADPDFTTTPPANFSGDATGITIKLIAHDSEPAGETDNNPAIIDQTDSITLNLYVNPVADDITLPDSSTTEDTAVTFLTSLALNDTGAGGTETVETITINNLATNWVLKDHTGGTVLTGDGTSDFSIDITGGTYSLAEAKLFTLTPPAHGSADHTALAVDITVKDSETVNSVIQTSTTTFNHTIDVTVSAVSETKTADTDGANGNDVETQGDHVYDTHLNEDNAFVSLDNLDFATNGFVLSVTNEDDVNSGIPGASETTIVNFSGVPVGSIFKYGSTELTVTNSSTGVDVPLADIAGLQFKPLGQYSGAINILMKVRTTDADEDDAALATEAVSAADTLSIVVDAVANQAVVAVKRAVGNEDAGRTTGNTANDGGASTLDAPDNGIDLNILAISDDLDGSESFTLYLDYIPDAVQIYYNGTTMTNLSGISGNLTADDAGGGAGNWKLTITNFDSAAPLKFIPPHNDNSDYTIKVSARSIDGAVQGTETTPVDMDVIVKGVADIPINDALASATATDDDSDVNSYTIATTESTVDGNNGKINLNTVFAGGGLDSYDNADGSEKVTVTITNLDSQFSLTGAIHVIGAGNGRKWVFNAEDAGNVKLIVPEHYSGEIDFDLAITTTESDGDSNTHATKNISIMVEPTIESSINLAGTQGEDSVLNLDFSFDGHPDSNETLEAVWIDLSTKPVDVTLKDGSGTELVANDGNFVKLTGAAINDVHAHLTADNHLGGSCNLDIKYEIKDTVDDTTGNPYSDVNIVTGQTYTVTVNAISDPISLALGTIKESDGVDDNISVAGNTVTITDNALIDIPLTVTGVDDPGEGSNGADDDSSEQFTRIEVHGVPKGISVVGGIYAGDVYDSGSTNFSGLWLVDIPDQALDADGGAYTLQISVDGNAASYTDSGAITIKTFANDVGSFEQVAQQDVTLTCDGGFVGSGAVIGTPATINTFSQKAGSDLTEDTSFNLNSITDTTVTGSGNFAITLSNLRAGTTVNGMTEYTTNGITFWSLTGAGDDAAIEATLAGITITPPPDFNTSDGADATLDFNIVLSTYETGGQMNVTTINYEGTVLPVTDLTTLNIDVTGDGNEDTVQTITIEVSNSSDASKTQIVDEKLYIKLTENYTDAAGNGVFRDFAGTPLSTQAVVGVSGITDGSYYVINGVIEGETLTFTYEPLSNAYGTITLDAYLNGIESEGWPAYDTTQLTTSNTADIVIAPLADGLTAFNVTASGTEDTLVEVNIAGVFTDSSEKIFLITIDNVPDGFLVKYGANAGSAVLAQNAGLNGTTTIDSNTVNSNLWNIPISGGAMPGFIGIVPPMDWSGTIPSVTVTAKSGETSGSISQSITIDIDVNPVADSATITPTLTFGDEGDDILINIHANIKDIDGSETATLELVGIGAGASFKENGVYKAAAYVGGSDTYTITGIESQNIDSMTFVQTAFTGIVAVTLIMVDTASGLPTSTATAVTDNFTADVSTATATTGDDTLLYNSAHDSDGLAGSDSLIFRLDEGIDFTAVANTALLNMEIIDLSKNGDHALTNLTGTDAEAMTDVNNILRIHGEAGDSISLLDDTSGIWLQTATGVVDGKTYDEYTNVGGPANGTLVKIEQGVTVTHTRATGTAADDILVFDGTTDIDGQGGYDTLYLNSHVLNIDFQALLDSKLQNLEKIDLAGGDHTLDKLSLTDLQAMTDANNDLKINGDADDSVNFKAGDGWVKGGTVSEDGNTYDIYTNSNDAGVEVKVQDSIVDVII